MDEYPPPWVAGISPDDPATQGLAKAYIVLNWLPFWHTLSPDRKTEYLDRWQASSEWRAVIAMRYEIDPVELDQDAIESAEWRMAHRRSPVNRPWWRFWE